MPARLKAQMNVVVLLVQKSERKQSCEASLTLWRVQSTVVKERCCGKIDNERQRMTIETGGSRRKNRHTTRLSLKLNNGPCRLGETWPGVRATFTGQMLPVQCRACKPCYQADTHCKVWADWGSRRMGLGSDMSPSVMAASRRVVILPFYSGRGEVGQWMLGR